MSNDTPPNADVPALADRILRDAMEKRASDLHVEPVAQGYEVRMRVDGLLETVARHSSADGRALVNRLMVLSQLLTYRQDIPQEGRMSFARSNAQAGAQPQEFRISIMPTHLGMRAVVRLPADLTARRTLDELGLPDGALAGLKKYAAGDSGMLIVTGPAGAGKTTTIYALLEQIAQLQPGLSIIALEDPVERNIPGVTQIEVKPFGELTYERALKSILRQDPQVLMLGEIRDAATASLAIQAALSGHRLICTLHAGTPQGAVGRLLEMGIEPYQIANSLYGILSQRLLRNSAKSGGYSGRIPAAEWVIVDGLVRKAILAKADADEIGVACARQPGHLSLRQSAMNLVSRGLTDEVEVMRVLGT